MAAAPHPGKFIFQHFSVNVDQISSQEQEDDLNSLVNARQPQFFLNWKTTYIFLNWKTTSNFLMEDDLHFEVNGRRP